MVAKKAVKKSVWAERRAEALKDYKPKEPFLFDAVDPPIRIDEPTTVEQTLAMAMLLDDSGSIVIPERDLKGFLQTICGQSFPRVWQVLRHEPAEVLMPFIRMLNEHFNGLPDEGVDEVPGKGLA